MCPWCGKVMETILLSCPARCPHCFKPIMRQERPWIRVEPKPPTDKEGGPNGGVEIPKVGL